MHNTSRSEAAVDRLNRQMTRHKQRRLCLRLESAAPQPCRKVVQRDTLGRCLFRPLHPQIARNQCLRFAGQRQPPTRFLGVGTCTLRHELTVMMVQVASR